MSTNMSFFALALVAIWMVFTSSLATAEAEVSSVKDGERAEVAKILQILAADRILQENGFEQYKRAEPYGHLRFGRSVNNNNRFKYADPDYGHMRFGR